MISGIIKVEVNVISQSRRLRLITLTSTLIILDITKTESNNFFIIHCFKANNDKCIITPQFIFDTPYSYFAVPNRELDIALGNHALRAQPTDYSPICRLCCFPELTVGFQPMRRQMMSTMYNENN